MEHTCCVTVTDQDGKTVHDPDTLMPAACGKPIVVRVGDFGYCDEHRDRAGVTVERADQPTGQEPS